MSALCGLATIFAVAICSSVIWFVFWESSSSYNRWTLTTLRPSSLLPQHGQSLEPFAFSPLALGSISPSGWLKDQLQLMADGLAGHQYEFYYYVAQSSWLGGGREYSALNEGFPYWFNGLVPLAYGLNDERLKHQVHNAVQKVFDLKQDDGWLGPERGTARNFWARYPFFLGLTQLAEANATWTEPVVSHLQTFMPLMYDMLTKNYTGYLYHDGDDLWIGKTDWGRVRSQDMMLTLQWLYENHPSDQKTLLLQIMKLLHDQGLNWEDWYNEEAYLGRHLDRDLNTISRDITDPNFPFEHGVNVGQGLKAAAVIRRFTHNDSLVQTAMNGVNWTMLYHGTPSGSIIADERLVGTSQYSGSELCTSVETMYSLSYLYQALGTRYYADRAELAAFNSFPAMMTADWWAHQYMQVSSQPYATNLTESPFYNTNSWSQTFGLEPHYPCCTVNHPQGWPKFLSASWAKLGDNGLVHALLVPSTVSNTVGGANVTIECVTAYPFLERLSYSITTLAPFALYIRVPEWAEANSSIQIDNGASSPPAPDPETGLHKIDIKPGSTSVAYTLSSTIRTTPRANDTVAIYKGALLYALRIPHTATSTPPKRYNNPTIHLPPGYAPLQSRDWEYHNASAWNYAIDPRTLKYHGPEDAPASYQLKNPIFEADAPPGYIEVQGCQIAWPMHLDSVPGFPPLGKAKACIADVETLKLVPYGSAKTHMAELPVIDLLGK